MSNGSDIAAEVLAGLTEAGEATGDGKLTCVLRKPGIGETPWDYRTEPDLDSEVTAVQTSRIERDGTGMVLRTVRMLLVDATGSPVEKGDLVAVGFRVGLASDDDFDRIEKVDVLAPGGIPVLYTASLVD